jgi:hypothetical protein
MWSARRETQEQGRVIKFAIDGDEAPLPYAEAMRLWQEEAEFRDFFIELLAGAPFAAFRWETPPVTTATSDRDFGFVLLDSPGLARTPERDAFADHFTASTADVISFANLGGDAILVVPAPRGDSSLYGHLAAFIREAPQAQQHELWTLVGKAMTTRVGKKPVWLSTAGAGVSWLHVRLDDRPKYYGFRPYRDAR